MSSLAMVRARRSISSPTFSPISRISDRGHPMICLHLITDGLASFNRRYSSSRRMSPSRGLKTLSSLEVIGAIRTISSSGLPLAAMPLGPSTRISAGWGPNACSSARSRSRLGRSTLQRSPGLTRGCLTHPLDPKSDDSAGSTVQIHQPSHQQRPQQSTGAASRASSFRQILVHLHLASRRVRCSSLAPFV